MIQTAPENQSVTFEAPILIEALNVIDTALETGDTHEIEDAVKILEGDYYLDSKALNTLKKGRISLIRSDISRATKGIENLSEMSPEQFLIEARNRIESTLISQPAANQAPPADKATRPIQSHSNPEPNTTTESKPDKELMTYNKLSEKVNPIIQSVLEDSSLFEINSDKNKSNPVSLALLKKLSFLDENELAELGTFLKQPGEAYLPKEANEFVDKPTKEIEMLVAGANKEIRQWQAQINELKDSRKTGKLKPEERKEIGEEITRLMNEINDKEQAKEYMEMSLAHQKGGMQYNTVEQVMYMAAMWIEQQKPGVSSKSELDIYNEVHRQIEDEKRGREPIKTWGLFKPRLSLILETIAEKNAHLNEAGADTVKELAGAWNDKGKVEVWLKDIEGTDEYKMDKIVPPLIGYLQLAVREGLSNNTPGVASKHAENLLKHLKSLRHEHAKKRVKDSLGPNASKTDKMTAYFNEITNMTVSEQDISREHITMNTGYKMIGKGAKVGLGALGALWWGAKKAGGLTGKLAVGAGKQLENLSKENKQGVERGLKRAVYAGTMAAGAIATGMTLGPASLLAMPFVFAPEMNKYKRDFASLTGKAAITAGTISAAIITMPALLIPRYSKWLLKNNKSLGGKWDSFVYSGKEKIKSESATNDGGYSKKKKEREKKEKKEETSEKSKDKTKSEKKAA